jgi:hypothetical protein
VSTVELAESAEPNGWSRLQWALLTIAGVVAAQLLFYGVS